MKPTHQTRDHLILRDSPWIATSLLTLLALAFLLLGMALLVPALRGGIDPDKAFLAWLFLTLIFLVGVGLPVAGIALLLEFTRVKFDRVVQFVEIRRRRLHRLQVQRVPLKDIKDAYLEPMWDAEEDTDVHTTTLICRPVLRQPNSTEELPLLLSYSNTRPHGALVDTINDWLDRR